MLVDLGSPFFAEQYIQLNWVDDNNIAALTIIGLVNLLKINARIWRVELLRADFYRRKAQLVFAVAG
jgi:hypothetical protein